jgi:hypothetical protein
MEEMWSRETRSLDTSASLDPSLGTVPRCETGVPEGADVASGGDGPLHHDKTLPSQLREALELFEADLPLTATQRALVRAALKTAVGCDGPLSEARARSAAEAYDARTFRWGPQ